MNQTEEQTVYDELLDKLVGIESFAYSLARQDRDDATAKVSDSIEEATDLAGRIEVAIEGASTGRAKLVSALDSATTRLEEGAVFIAEKRETIIAELEKELQMTIKDVKSDRVGQSSPLKFTIVR